MDFVQGLDPASLILVHSGVAFLCSAFVSPAYNLPIFLFGIYAQQYTESFEPLRIFTSFVGFSLLLDIIWFFNNEIPTFLSLMLALRQRGDRFGGGLPAPGGFGNIQETVWTMPTPAGRGAYQDIGGDTGAEPHPSKPLPTAPSPAPAAPTMPHPHPHAAPSAPAQQSGAGPGTFTI